MIRTIEGTLDPKHMLRVTTAGTLDGMRGKLTRLDPKAPIGIRVIGAGELDALLDKKRCPIHPQNKQDMFEERLSGARYDHDREWFGNLNLAEVTALVRNGWTDGAQMVQRLSAPLRAQVEAPVDVRRRASWTADGNDLDPDRALRGDWDVAWRGVKRRATGAPGVIRIGCGWWFSAAESADTLKWNGAMLLAMADALETAGYQTELWAFNGGTASWDAQPGCKSVGIVAVEVKQAGEPLNLAKLAAAIAHPAPYRWFGIPGDAAVAPGGRTIANSSGLYYDDTAIAAAAMGACEPMHLMLPLARREDDAKKILTTAVQQVNDRAAGLLAHAG